MEPPFLAQMTTLGSDFDTLLAVYDFSDGVFDLLGYNDDCPSFDGASCVSFDVPPGATYLLFQVRVRLRVSRACIRAASLHAPVALPPKHTELAHCCAVLIVSRWMASMEPAARWPRQFVLTALRSTAGSGHHAASMTPYFQCGPSHGIATSIWRRPAYHAPLFPFPFPICVTRSFPSSFLCV